MEWLRLSNFASPVSLECRALQGILKLAVFQVLDKGSRPLRSGRLWVEEWIAQNSQEAFVLIGTCSFMLANRVSCNFLKM